MCNVCGCGGGEASVDGHVHHHPDPPAPDHHHHPPHGSEHGEPGQGKPLHAHAPGLSRARMVEIEQDILAHNDAHAAANRRVLAKARTLALNLVSSPGSGKTTLLTATLARLRGRLPLAVIEGDQQTTVDADRIRETGVPAVQINTGKGCHLDAHMVGRALENIDASGGILFIENVGNLVCPAGFDLGEAHKVVILSVTEGEDKPLKYPDMFHACDVMVVTKTDLLPHLDFDVDALVANARRINPQIVALRVSARTGAGMQAWLDWIATAHARQAAPPEG